MHPYTADTLHTLTADDVHSFITDDVVRSLTAADVVVCSQSIYTRPQLTDSLGAQHACLPACTSTTATATQPPLPARLYNQPAPALTAARQPVISVQQSVTDLHQLFVTAGVQQQSAAIVYTQPTHSHSLTAWTATALPLGTQLPQPSVSIQPPQPSVSAYTADAAVLSDAAQSPWMLPVGAYPAQLVPGLPIPS